MAVDGVPYRGRRRKLVLAFDLGTTFSGVSYCVLSPRSVPEIKGVTRFPAHERISGACKIPSVIYYDREGTVQAVGAEAEGIFEEAEYQGWVKAEFFKLHICPKDGSTTDIIPLPTGKSVMRVVADYLSYLHACTRSYIRDTHANGRDVWASVEGENTEFVLSYPNGWDGFQQSQIRQAVVMAGLVPDTAEGHGRVVLVSEGEAILHFALRHGLPTGTMEGEEGVVVVDAGRHTIDISTYQKPVGREKFEEISAPKCHTNGSIFVSIHARVFIQELLKDSDYVKDLDHIVRCFDKTTKIRFSDDKKMQYIKFGSTRDKDEKIGIRYGQLKLDGTDVAGFFAPSINAIVNTIEDQLRQGTHHITHVVLVGGFGASDWLFKQLQSLLGLQGLKVVRPDLSCNNAVSDGAVAFHLPGRVHTKYSYGTLQNVEYNASDPDHQARLNKLLVRPSGRRLVPCEFAVMLEKGTLVSDDNEVKVHLWMEVDKKEQLAAIAFNVHCYTGVLEHPKFHDMDPKAFKKVCSIEADMSHIPLVPEQRKNGNGTFYTIKYWVVLKFNSAGLKAQMVWTEHGIEKRSPERLVLYQDS